MDKLSTILIRILNRVSTSIPRPTGRFSFNQVFPIQFQTGTPVGRKSTLISTAIDARIQQLVFDTGTDICS